MSRAKYVYTLPESLAKVTGVKSIAMVELTAGEEIMAANRARGEQVRLAWELSKESLREIDGKPLSQADGSLDTAWNTMHPKLRNLVMQAYNELHNNEAGDVGAFLKSRQVEA